MLLTLSHGEHSQNAPEYPSSHKHFPQTHSPLSEQIFVELPSIHCCILFTGELSSQSHVSPVNFNIISYRLITFQLFQRESTIETSYRTNRSRICINHIRSFRTGNGNFRYLCNYNHIEAQRRLLSSIIRTPAHPRSQRFVSDETQSHVFT